MASVSQVPSSSSGSNKNLHDVLRSLSQRSLKRRRMVEDDNEEEEEYQDDLPLEPSPVASSGAAQNDDHDQEDREDRFVQLASSILYVDSSCRKNIKRKRNNTTCTEDASTDTKTTTSKDQNATKASVKTEKDATRPLDIVDVHIQADLDRYKALLQAEEDQIQHIQNTPNRIRQEQVDLWGLYKYGLNKIKNLNDLGKAPDAVMPGNFGQ